MVIELSEESVHDKDSGVEVTKRDLMKFMRLLPFYEKECTSLMMK